MYEPYPITYFDRKYKKLKKDQIAMKRINDGVNVIMLDPYNKSESLQGNLKGKRKHRKGKLRIVFAICEECRKLENDSLINCGNCDQIPELGIRLFDLDYRGNIYN